ncbi:MAG: hypothetical protein HY591_01575, partial [Candidatus Omnitrophica bacterium]|nr:hypothetical protein [Candidatus Omnitrophota bacterium]
MKTVKIILLSIPVLFAIIAAGLFIFLKTFDLNRYLPQITKSASEASGRAIDVGRADLNISFQGIVLDVSGIRVADIVPGPRPLVEVDKVRARIEAGSFLAQRKIEISNIVILGTRVTIGDLGISIPMAQAQVPYLVVGGKGLEGFNARMEFAGGELEFKDLFKGKINGHMNISGQGPGPETLLKNIKGQGEINISDGVIDTFNVLKAVLGSVLGAVPGLAGSVDGMIAQMLKDKLGEDSGKLEKALAKFTIEDAVVFWDDVMALTKALELKAKGTVGFDMNTDMQVAVLVAENISADLAKKVEPLGYLRDDARRIKISGQLAGTMPDVKFHPSVDLKSVGTNAIIEEGSKQLQKVIEKNPVVGDILNDVLNN